jgi:hypothetical protein
VNWIDDAERETQASIERLRLITEHQEEVYEALWQEVKAQIEDAKRIERFKVLFTNGGQLSRVVRLPVQGGTREISFELNKHDNRIITKRSGDHYVYFDIDVCDDGIVCLKLNEKPVTLKDAAQAALRPFLFVELYSPLPQRPPFFPR